jgi:hypothetical protein
VSVITSIALKTVHDPKVVPHSFLRLSNSLNVLLLSRFMVVPIENRKVRCPA